RLVTDQLVLTVGYDIESLTNPDIRDNYHGDVTTDHYGRQVPKHAHGTANLDKFTSSTRQIMKAVASLYDRIFNPNLLIRRLTLKNIFAHLLITFFPPLTRGFQGDIYAFFLL
ncbi:MAG: hypothetical protein MR784_03150, partial [Rikenellaceae bacterium]|nr:hypothetical protein [Rikenellaceae bacterium]